MLLCRLGLPGCLMEPPVLLLMVPLGLLRLLGPHKGLLKGQTLLILWMLVGLAGPPWSLVPPGLLGLQPLALILEKPLV